jgi:DNA-binding transcriptional LysR family regulator
MSAELLSGNVIRIMPEFEPESTELWLICPSRQSITPAVRLLMDAFKEKCRGIPNQLIEECIVEDSVLADTFRPVT